MIPFYELPLHRKLNMSGGNGGVNFMEISKSSHSDTRMAVDGSSLNTLMDFTVEEKTATKEWVSNPDIGSVQQDESCQDDMFSYDELSVVEDQQEGVETTVCTVSVASIPEQGYDQASDSGKGSVTIPISDEMTEQGLHDTCLQETTVTGQTNVNIIKNSIEGGADGYLPSDDSGAAVEKNNCHSFVELEVKAQVPSSQSQPQEELIKNTTVEQSILGSTAIDDTRKALSYVQGPHGSQNNHTDQIDARDAFDISPGDKDQKEPVQLNQLILDNSQDVEMVSTPNAFSTKQEDQPHLNRPEYEQLESFCEQKQPETAVMKEKEEVSHKKEPGSEALKGILDCQKQPEMKAASDISTGDEDQKDLVHVNRVTLDNSQHVENVMTTEVENHRHLNLPETEQTELIWEQKQPEGAGMREDDCHQRQPGQETLIEKKEDPHQQQPEMEAMKEEMPSTAQASGGVDDKPQVNDNTVSTCDGQLPSTQFENVQQEMTVLKATEEPKEVEATAFGHLGSGKEEFASDLSHPVQELLENMHSENALQNTSTLASLDSNPDLPQGAITKCNAEPVQQIAVGESESIQKEFESFKGRKVSKRFNKKKFLGEVIGYDPETRWFKVLYEDGDDEELEKEELDCILLPVGDAKASVSRKRHLSVDDAEHKKPNGSARKSRKVDRDSTPGKSRKDDTAGDQTPPSQQTSVSKKKMSTVARGKSKSSKTGTPKTQTRKKKESSAKKSTEKKGSSNSSHTKNKKKPKSSKKQSVGKLIQESAKQHSSLTRSLKFDSAKKKTPTKLKKSSQQDSPTKDKITRSGRTVRVPNKSPKARSVADQVEVHKISTAEKSKVHTPNRKRKLVSDIQDGISTVDSKRAKKSKSVNDMKTPLASSMKSRNIVEDAKLQLSHEKTNDAEFQVQLNEENAESSVPQSTGNKRGKTDRGSVLIGRKVKKDFGGQFFGGEVVGYQVFYQVDYEDGDSEELTWKELESILLLDEEKQPVKSRNKQKKGSKRI